MEFLSLKITFTSKPAKNLDFPSFFSQQPRFKKIALNWKHWLL